MIKKIGSIIMFIVLFFGAKYLVQYGMGEFQYGMGEYSESKAISAVNDTFSEMEIEADKYSAQTPRSIALQEVAIKKAEENINSQASPLKKRQAALSTFMGFYLVNHRTRSNFCKNLGVNISTFSNKFKILHQSEMGLSKQLVFKKAGDVEKLYKILKPQLEKLIQQNMADISSAYDVTLSGACELIEKNGITFAEEMTLSKIQPAVYQAIHDEK